MFSIFLVVQDLTMSRLSIHEVFADEVAAFYGRERGLRVLDVGAGTGRMGKAVSRPALVHFHIKGTGISYCGLQLSHMNCSMLWL